MSQMSDYYVVIDENRHVTTLVQCPGTVTSPRYINVTKDIYDAVAKDFVTEKCGVTYGEDGTITTFTLPPPSHAELKEQAQSALSSVQSQAAIIVAMGESFGPKTKSYVQALQAIINDTDTTSTELPAKPDDLTS